MAPEMSKLIQAGRKATGPRTAAGKRKASRNAVRHGLAAITHRAPLPSVEIERLARAICGSDSDPELLARARTVAANESILETIRVEQCAAIERLRDSTANPLVKRSNGNKLGVAVALRAWLAYRELQSLLPTVIAKYKDRLPNPVRQDRRYGDYVLEDDMVPVHVKALLEESDEPNEALLELARQLERKENRDEAEAVKSAAPDLVKLERYYRRAWSRQKRALLGLLARKHELRFQRSEAG